MAIEHAAITDPNIHEPKGISSATSGQVYLSDGIGSGNWVTNAPDGLSTAVAGAALRANGAGGVTWTRDAGWGEYQDDRQTVGSPVQNIVAAARDKLLCNGLNLTEEVLPEDAAAISLWDTTTNKIKALALNDVFLVRVGFSVENYAGTSPYIELEIDEGGLTGSMYKTLIPLLKGGAEQQIGLTVPIFVNSDFLANDAEIYVTYAGTGSIDVFSTDIMITRISKAYV